MLTELWEATYTFQDEQSPRYSIILSGTRGMNDDIEDNLLSECEALLRTARSELARMVACHRQFATFNMTYAY